MFAGLLHIYLMSAVRRPDEQKCVTCTIGCCQWTQPVSELHSFTLPNNIFCLYAHSTALQLYGQYVHLRTENEYAHTFSYFISRI